MAIDLKIIGKEGTVAEVDGTTYRAQRVTNRPPDYGRLGSYRVSGLSGTMTAGLVAGSNVWQFHWADAFRLAVVHEVTLDGMSNLAAFTAGFANLALLNVAGWTVDGSGGSLTLAPRTAENKMRQTMGTSLDLSLRISTTGSLAVGTFGQRSIIARLAFAVDAMANAIRQRSVKLVGTDGIYAHPVVLGQNEGLSLTATVPATGTWQFGVTIGWHEVPVRSF